MDPKSSLVVSPRGQITLPANVRKKLGIKEGGVLTIETRGGEIVLRPAVVFEIETYSDDDVSDFIERDKFSPGEKEKLIKKLGKRA